MCFQKSSPVLSYCKLHMLEHIELNQNVLEVKGCSSGLETKKTKDPSKVNLIADIIKPGYRLEVKDNEFIFLKNAEVQVFELEN